LWINICDVLKGRPKRRWQKFKQIAEQRRNSPDRVRIVEG